MYPDLVSEPAFFIIVGMAAFFSGVAHVPIPAMIMVAEMTADYQLLIPAMIACSISHILVWRWSIYEKQLESRLDSPAHRGEVITDILDSMHVKDFINRDIISVSEDTRVNRVLSIIHDTRYPLLPVVEDGKVVGVVTYHDLLRTPLDDNARVKDIMRREFPIAYPFENLNNILKKMLNHKIDALPVIDPKDNSLLGLIDERDIIIGHEKIRRELEDTRVSKEFTVESIMKIDPIVAHPDMSIEEFYDMVKRHSYNTYPVVDNGILVGYISIKSLFKHDNAIYVKDVMNTNPIIAYRNESLDVALEKMFKSKSDMLMVVEESKIGKRLLGVVTKSDILLAYSALL